MVGSREQVFTEHDPVVNVSVHTLYIGVVLGDNPPVSYTVQYSDSVVSIIAFNRCHDFYMNQMQTQSSMHSRCSQTFELSNAISTAGTD